jgi:predicted DNA-binding protein YlxM (UPF0122 family)
MAGITKREQINRKIGLGVQKFNDDTVNKLRQAFAIDATIEEACFYSGISKQCYYDNVKKDKKLLDQLEALRNKPVLKARQTVVNSLDNPDSAKWYLERKRKKEFAQRGELTGADGKDLPLPILNNVFCNSDKI